MTKKRTPLPLILDHAPNTSMILGALLSGGDVRGLAEMLCQKDTEKEPEKPEGSDE